MSKRTRWVLGVGVLAAILFGPGAYELARLSIRQRELEQRLQQLAAERERLVQERERLQSDPTYLEGLIRGTFKYAKPSEYVIPLEAADE